MQGLVMIISPGITMSFSHYNPGGCFMLSRFNKQMNEGTVTWFEKYFAINQLFSVLPKNNPLKKISNNHIL